MIFGQSIGTSALEVNCKLHANEPANRLCTEAACSSCGLLCFRCVTSQHPEHAHFPLRKVVSDIESLRYDKTSLDRVKQYHASVKGFKADIARQIEKLKGKLSSIERLFNQITSTIFKLLEEEEKRSASLELQLTSSLPQIVFGSEYIGDSANEAVRVMMKQLANYKVITRQVEVAPTHLDKIKHQYDLLLESLVLECSGIIQYLKKQPYNPNNQHASPSARINMRLIVSDSRRLTEEIIAIEEETTVADLSAFLQKQCNYRQLNRVMWNGEQISLTSPSYRLSTIFRELCAKTKRKWSPSGILKATFEQPQQVCEYHISNY